MCKRYDNYMYGCGIYCTAASNLNKLSTVPLSLKPPYMLSRDCITDLDNNRPFFTMHACIDLPYFTEAAVFIARSAAENIVGLGAGSTSYILQHRFITSQCIPFRDKPLINRLHVRRLGRVFVSSIS